jgi:hypothetical protein
MKSPIKLLLTCVLLLFAAQAAAAGKLYDIELILFARGGGSGGEKWPSNPGKPDLQGVRYLKKGAKSYRILPKSQWRLGGAFSRLKSKEGYTPLLHLAWRQPVTSKKKAEAVHLASSTASGLEGTIKVSVGRYLHVDLDLLLGKSYRMQTHRRMRSKELHYLDHPKMGALVLISPVKASKK